MSNDEDGFADEDANVIIIEESSHGYSTVFSSFISQSLSLLQLTTDYELGLKWENCAFY